MKKFLLVATLILSSCQLPNYHVEAPKSEIEKTSQNQYQPETHDQFESRDLATPTIVKKKVEVAILLPFSGKNKDLGWSLFNTASMSLFDNDTNHNVELVLFDSKDGPEETKKAFQDIIARNIKIVIGPVFSTSVEAITDLAKENQITVISLSNNQDLMGNINHEGGVFLAGMLLESQIDKIVSYAMEHGKFSFSVIAPKNSYGNTATTLFKKIVKSRDGTFVTSQFYESNDKDVDRIAEHVIKAFTISPQSKNKKLETVEESDRTYSQVIFIPESGKILSKIVTSIKKQNIDERDFQIVGTNQWDDSSTLSDYNLVGAWFAAPDNKKFREFERSYYQVYNKFPPRISSITYDLVGAISQLIDRKNGETPTLTDFTNPSNPPKNGFEGIDGLFRFLPNGLVQRNLAVLKVGSGRFETIDEPVAQFLRY